jgi:hypothetical protein
VPESDNALSENSKQNLDKKLDLAVEETFPASDPVSMGITKGGAIDYGDEGVSASATREKPEQKSPPSTFSLKQRRSSVRRGVPCRGRPMKPMPREAGTFAR